MRISRLLLRPNLVKPVALASSWLLRLWMSGLDFRFRLSSIEANPAWADRGMLYLFWHEALLFPAYTHARYNVATLISRHRDGEFLAQVLRMLRGKAIRGSTTHDSVAGLRKMIRQGRFSHLAIAPDGPLGPRRLVQPGAVFLASRAGMPIVPLGFAFGACWRARSWDRMALPKPGQPARCVAGRPIEVPADLSREGLEECRRQVQQALEQVQAQAERLAAGGRPDGPLLTLRQVRDGHVPEVLRLR